MRSYKLTIRILGLGGLISLERIADSDVILSHDSEFVVISLLQLLDGDLCLSLADGTGTLPSAVLGVHLLNCVAPEKLRHQK